MSHVPLRRAAVIVAGQAPAGTEVAELSAGFPFIQGNAEFGPTYPTPRLQCESAAKRSLPGDLLLSVRAPVGAMNWSNRALGIGRGVAAIRPRPGWDIRYVAYGLIATLADLRAAAAGSTFEAVTSDSLGSHWLPVAASGEQRRIADFLDDRVARIDQIVSARRRQVALLGAMRTSRLDELVLGRHLADESAAAADWLPFGSIPQGWREGRLRNLQVEVQTGPFGSQLHSDEYVPSGWPVVNPASLTEGGLRAVPGMSVDDETRDRLIRHVLREGDIVFGRRGEMGRAALVTRDEVGWLCGTGSLRVRLHDALMLPAYLVTLLRTAPVRHYFTLTSVGSTMDNLNTGILLGVPVLVPPVQDQERLLDNVDLTPDPPPDGESVSWSSAVCDRFCVTARRG